MVPGRRYNVGFARGVLRRRWWLLIAPPVLTGVLGVVVAKALPNVFYTQTVVGIVPQRIPETYVRSTVTVSLAERLASTSQHVLSRTQLEKLILELNLFPTLRETVPMEPLILWFRSGIRVQMLQPDAFVVGYAGYGPAQVKLVVDRLTDLFVEQGRREREALADSTSNFLESELSAARGRLEEQERRVEEYRRANAGQLPSQLEANLRILQSTSAQLHAQVEALSRDRDRRDQVSRELATLTAPADAVPAAAEEPGLPITDTPVELPAGPPSVQLQAARTARQKLLLRLTPEHPDVKALDTLISRMEAAAAGRPVGAVAEGTSAAAEMPRVTELKKLLASLDQQIAARQAVERNLRQDLATYQARVESVPQKESEWIKLTRDYNTLQGVYADLSAKHEASRIAASLERQAVGEQFRIVERPTVPSRPISPNRPMIVVMSLAFGAGFGVFVIVLLELRRNGLYAEEEVVAALNLPVVGLVPMIVTQEDRRRALRRKILWSAVMVMGCVCLAVLRWAR